MSCNFFSEQCTQSKALLCEHGQVLEAQFTLDNLRWNMMPQLQHKRNCFSGISGKSYLVWDEGEFSDLYTKELCTKPLETRGWNAGSASQKMQNEFYMRPCPTMTFHNSLNCTTDKCCSYSHQLFANHTRQGTGKQLS